MKDVVKPLLKALTVVLDNATGLTSYTRIPKQEYLSYPYIYISDIYQQENGPKTGYRYSVDLLVRIIYKDVDSLIPLLDKKNKVLELINNASPFAIEGFKIESCELQNSFSSESYTDTGVESIENIRLIFDIV